MYMYEIELYYVRVKVVVFRIAIQCTHYWIIPPDHRSREEP